jgi:uncharacterized lipoprotein YddW (UPF0748 family)
MIRPYRKFVALTATIMILFSCSTPRNNSSSIKVSRPDGPKAAAEFRAAWVATVANINWPSKPGLPVAEQKREAIELLDFLQAHNFNAVIFQVRPQADALYDSKLEPWSYYLTGEQGKAPEPYYDPLAFWIEAAHERGLELHVWLNPYRAHHVAGGPISDKSIVKTKPELVVPLKQGYWWFDPAKKGTQDHGLAVVMDIVKRYDIDGVHFDDYFYPYPSYNGNEDFPDNDSYAEYEKAGGKLSRDDWRRESVNKFIERLYKAIKAEKKHVKFGLSPFGIWRPGHPESVGGFDQYSVLYADAKLWLNKGWVDYFSPQLYWSITSFQQSFPVLLGWWAGENWKQRHLWPGISVGRDTSRLTTMETLNQIMISRGMLKQNSGVIHWSISSVTKNPAMAKALINGPYKNPALVPPSTWLDDKAPLAPVLKTTQKDTMVHLQWTHPDEKDVFRWVVYYQYGNAWQYRILNRGDRSTTLAAREGKNMLNQVAITAVDRSGNESEKTVIHPHPVVINPRTAWQAAAPKPYKTHVPVRITVHHEGTRLEKTDDAAKKIKNIQTWGMGKDRNWTDVPYHYFIAPDGTVFEGRNPNMVGETNTEYDPTGHLLICCLGNYEEQEFTSAQLDALTRLIAWACAQYNISYETIASHRDHSKQTTCPGRNLYQYFQNGYIKNRVKELLGENGSFTYLQ